MAENKPNLIFIFADQLRYQSLGYNDDIKAKTPNIDMLAQFSTVMDNCVSNHPLSAPYRASLFTGKYSTSTGVIADDIKINPNQQTFASILKDNGYKTSYIGKWALNGNSKKKNSFIDKGPDRLGFDDYFAAYNNHNKYFKPKAYYHLDSNEKVFYDEYEPDAQTKLAISNIELNSKEKTPFALFLSFSTPSGKWNKNNVPEEYYNKYEKANFSFECNYDSINDIHADKSSKLNKKQRKLLNEWKKIYYSMISNIDDNIGKIMQKIVELKIDDNTIIVFTSTCGEMFGSHGRKEKNIFYEESIRVPFIIRYGEKLYAGKNESCFGSVDIMPTLLGLMGIEIPETVQGRDKSQYILNGTSDDVGQLLMGLGPANTFADGKEWRAYRTKQFTYAVYKIDNEEMLFDNFNDPYQLQNLIFDSNYLEIGKEIKDKMYEEMYRIGDSFEKNSYYKKKWLKNRSVKSD